MDNTKSSKKNLFLTMAFVFLAFAIYKGFAVFLDQLNLNYYSASVIKEAVLVATAIAGAVIVKKVNVLKFTGKGFGTGLLTGFYFIIMAIVSACIGLFSAYILETITISTGEFFLFVLHMFMVGFAEELLFRGILQNAFHDYFGNDSLKHVRMSIIFTALFFGFCHIFNVFTGASLSGSVIQAIANIANGMLFCAIYYRTGKNLWVCIILHGIYDFGVNIMGGALNGTSISNQISNASSMAFVIAGGVLLLAIFITRGKKVRPLLDNDEESNLQN